VKRPSPTSRRLLSLAATLSIGVLAALAISSPASAHHGAVTGTVLGCEATSGKWRVQWTVENLHALTTTITSITASDSAPITGFAVNTEIAGKTQAGSAKVSGVQLVDGSKNGPSEVTLKVHLVWSDKFQEDVPSQPVGLKPGECTKPSPSPSPSATRSPSPVPSAVASASPSSGGGAGGGGGLPVTGVSGIAFASVALALIGGGAVLVLLGRRRRGSTAE
jgi:hypothetical protein